MCVCVSRISSQTISSTPRKAAKSRRKPKSSTLSYFCRISAWNIFRRCYMVWHSSTTMSVTQLLAENLQSITYFGILYPKVLCCLLKTSLYFSLPISRSMSSFVSFVDKTMEGILSSFNSPDLFQHLHKNRQNCNKVFRPKKMNSSLYLSTLEQTNAEISLNRILF